MPTTANQGIVRFQVKLNDVQNEKLEEYHYKTTLFWNLLRAHLKDKFDAYMAAEPSDEADKEITAKAEAFFESFFVPDPGLLILPGWGEYVGKIKDLPKDVLRCRLVDLVNAFILAKKTNGSGEGSFTGIPRRKTAKSSQSVRFTPGMYELNGNTIQLLCHPRLQFTLPDWPVASRQALDAIIENSSLSITRRRIQEPPGASLGPKDDDHLYSVTFRPVTDASQDD